MRCSKRVDGWCRTGSPPRIRGWHDRVRVRTAVPARDVLIGRETLRDGGRPYLPRGQLEVRPQEQTLRRNACDAIRVLGRFAAVLPMDRSATNTLRLMYQVHPEVFLIARPSVDWDAVRSYIERVGGEPWIERVAGESAPDGELLAEFMGRLCYRSWAPNLNPNVSSVRTDSRAYLINILESAHGSVLEHLNYSFVFHNVSRVFTHELVRHRAGTAISQESMRYVRLENLPFEHPDVVQDDPELLAEAERLLASMEQFQELVVERAELTGADFNTKKVVTSSARRYAPQGVATSIGWTANVRALRHILATRTAPGAEQEIRVVFGKVGDIMKAELPVLFDDFESNADGSWAPRFPKV